MKESKEYSEWLSSKLWDKGAAVTLPWEQNSIIHMAFQHVLLEELVTWQWLTAASRLNSYPLLCFVANVPLSHLLAAVIALFCRQYDIIKDNDSSNNKEKAKPSSERSTPEHHSGGLLRSKVKSQDWGHTETEIFEFGSCEASHQPQTAVYIHPSKVSLYTPYVLLFHIPLLWQKFIFSHSLDILVVHFAVLSWNFPWVDGWSNTLYAITNLIWVTPI